MQSIVTKGISNYDVNIMQAQKVIPVMEKYIENRELEVALGYYEEALDILKEAEHMCTKEDKEDKKIACVTKVKRERRHVKSSLIEKLNTMCSDENTENMQ